MDFIGKVFLSVAAFVSSVFGIGQVSVPQSNSVLETSAVKQVVQTQNKESERKIGTAKQSSTTKVQGDSTQNTPAKSPTQSVNQGVIPQAEKSSTVTKAKPSTEVVMRPVVDNNAGVGSTETIKVERGTSVKVSWNVIGAKDCDFTNMATTNRTARLRTSDSSETVPIINEEKYRLFCLSANDDVLVATLVLQALHSTKAPTCSVTASPLVVEEGQIVTYTINGTDVLALSIENLKAINLGATMSLPYKHKKLARLDTQERFFVVSNEVGSAKCSAKVIVTKQSNSEGVSLAVDKIPTFVWVGGKSDVPLSYAVKADSASADPSQYSMCMSMRDNNGVRITEEDCWTLRKWERVEVLTDLSLAPDMVGHKEFWTTPGSKMVKVNLRIIRGNYMNESSIVGSIAEDDTGYFTMTL